MNRTDDKLSRCMVPGSWALSVGSWLLSGAVLVAQVPDAPSSQPPPSQPAPASSAPTGASGTGGSSGGQSKESGGFLGTDLPSFNPGSEILSWDGKNWNINNNRLFEARFLKYLNAPEETSADDKAYQQIIYDILNRLAPGNATTANVDYAFKLLPRAAMYDVDARLCASLADAVYSAWMAQRQQARLVEANRALEEERKRHEWNAQMAGEGIERKRRDVETKKNKDGSSSTQEVTETMALTPSMTRLAEVMTQIKANQAKRALSEVQMKIEFQALLVQFFLQRRFQHVLMGTRFYRAIFSDGDTKLQVGKDTKDLFEKSVGMPPTVGTIDSFANEAVRDVREGVKTFEFLLENNELESATKRLAEAFTVGEFLPEIRTLPREKKRQAVSFAQKSYQLVSALDVKDYERAEKLVKEIREMAKDFDESKPLALIETSKTVARMHLAKARNAALSDDRATLETELKAATELWPRNPELKEVAGRIYEQGDLQQKAIVELDQLIGQKNYWQIFDNAGRFLAATALFPERQKQLQGVLKSVETLKTALMRAEEMRKQNNFAGAWESVERVAVEYPDDTRLNQMRADLTTQAADFVRSIRGAQELEKKDQIGSSLAWFLKAQKIYPASEFAQEGIDRLKKQILPDSQPLSAQ